MNIYASTDMDVMTVFAQRPEGAVSARATLFLAKTKDCGVGVVQVSIKITFFDENGASIGDQLILDSFGNIGDLTQMCAIFDKIDIDCHGE